MEGNGKGPTHPHDRSRVWAYVLIIGGLVLLAANLGPWGWLGRWPWALVFFAGSGAFLYYYKTRSKEWWAIIPGFALAAIGVSVVAGSFGGPLLLLLLGAGFGVVYLWHREQWWAIIPAGALITLALVAYSDQSAGAWGGGWLLFAGLAATFAALAFLPTKQGGQRWALIPAVVLAGLAFLTLTPGAFGRFVLPVVLVIAGAYLWWRGQSPGGRHMPPDTR